MRPPRILRHTAAALSLLLFIATVALWIRSHQVGDWLMLHYRFEYDAGRTYWTYYLLRTGDGAIGFERYTLDLGLPPPHHFDPYRRRTPFLRTHEPTHPDDDDFPIHDARLGQLPLPETIFVHSRKIKELDGQRRTVPPDGMISLNLLDEFSVAGLTRPEAEARINALITKYSDNPEVRIQVETMYPPVEGTRHDERSFLGFKSHRAALANPLPFARQPAAHRFRIVAPLWAPALLFSLPPLLFLRRLRRTHFRRRHNLCPSCGYDLRATPTRCPECGHVPHPGPATSPTNTAETPEAQAPFFVNPEPATLHPCLLPSAYCLPP